MGEFKYKAFISYSHKDMKWARWLHRRLEAYVFPKYTIGRQTAFGPVPKNLKPIFRDRDELAAAEDLGAKIETALSQSETLIVICSPAAAASHWVNQEVLYFKQHNRGAKILSVIVEGEPYATDLSGREAEECMPPALRFKIGQGGEMTEIPAEPLAADMRAGADGKRLGLLKLISGMAGLELDDLVRRDLVRARRRVTTITVSAVSAVLAMGSLTWLAVDARQEAETRRAEAEGLIEFMLTDLRDKLEPVGRLDVLGDVASQALHYYDDKDAKQLSCKEVSGKARAHYLQARIASDLGNAEDANSNARQALEIMDSRASVCLDEPHFIVSYAHAQQWAMESKLRFLDDKGRDRDYSDDPEVKSVFAQYERSKDVLTNLKSFPDWDYDYAVEMADADLLTGALYFKIGRPEESREALRSALKHIEKYNPEPDGSALFLELEPARQSRIIDKYADILSWLSAVAEELGQYETAMSLNRRCHQLYLSQALGPQTDVKNWAAEFAALEADYALARLLFQRKDLDVSLEILETLNQKMRQMLARDPKNEAWQEFATRVERTQTQIMQINE